MARQPALSTTQPVTVLTCRHVRGTLLRGVGDGIGEHLGRGTPATVSVVDEDERSAQDSARPVVDAGGALGKVVLVAQGAGIGLRTRTHTHRGRSGRFRPSRRDASLPPIAMHTVSPDARRRPQVRSNLTNTRFGIPRGAVETQRQTRSDLTDVANGVVPTSEPVRQWDVCAGALLREALNASRDEGVELLARA